METPQFILRLRTSELMQAVLEMPKQEQEIFFGFPDAKRLEQEIENIHLAMYDNFYAGRWFEFILKTNNEVIGGGGYHTWWRRHDRAELGYWINDEKHRGKKFMTEILPALLQYGWDEMKLNRIHAITGMDNLASQKLLKKFGFQSEGILHGHYKIENNTYEDDELFYLLKK